LNTISVSITGRSLRFSTEISWLQNAQQKGLFEQKTLENDQY
jgi:hypothetical protein